MSATAALVPDGGIKMDQMKQMKQMIDNGSSTSAQVVNVKKQDTESGANAWMHLQSTVEEINIKERYFAIDGWLCIFWKDDGFDSKEFERDVESKTEDVKTDDVAGSDLKVYRKTYEKDGTEKMEYVILTEHIESFRPRGGSWVRGKYGNMFPFKNEERPFRNASNIELSGCNAIELTFNEKMKVFKLHIAFSARFDEYFENIDLEFPFEWQFLNIQIPYNPDFIFAAALPDFVKEAYVYREYWEFGPDMWNHAVVVEKRANLMGWYLLDSWVDLRGMKWDKKHVAKKRNEYKHQFGFGVIKHRVVRNPTYYITYVILPLDLMVSSAFSIFFLNFDDDEDEYTNSLGDRLQILVTLLLTVAAFQLQIVDNLPFTDQYTLIDQYFLLAYFVLAGLTIESSLVRALKSPRMHDIVYGIVFLSIWQIHSLQFAFKYFKFGGYGSGYHFWSWNTALKFGSCGMVGLCDAVKMCLFRECGGCCRSNKRQRRLKRWLRAEMRESALWDWGLSGNEKYAELVLGTDGDVNFELEMKRHEGKDLEEEVYRLKKEREGLVQELIVEYGLDSTIGDESVPEHSPELESNGTRST